MVRRNVFFVFATGLLTGVVGMIAVMGSHAVPRAMAQGGQPPHQPGPTSPGRYQVAAWAHPGAIGAVGAGSLPSAHGVYVLDTQTGKVWQAKDAGELEPIGMAK